MQTDQYNVKIVAKRIFLVYCHGKHDGRICGHALVSLSFDQGRTVLNPRGKNIKLEGRAIKGLCPVCQTLYTLENAQSYLIGVDKEQDTVLY